RGFPKMKHIAIIIASGLLAAGTFAKDKEGWTPLFNGKNLDGWETCVFGGDGVISVEDGSLSMALGEALTGVRYTGKKIPKVDYEIALSGRRVSGNDFFCGLTFQVGDKPCSLILGGWGGTVCGLSNLDTFDASENETTTYQNFEAEKWYKVRLRVTKTHVKAWLDDKKIVDVDISAKAISIRPEVELSLPFGIAAWQTHSELRDIRFRSLKK
ncbi:MAG: hypothetical protein ACI8W8_003763, partial [Rhodothermales bacterium]